ncbi:50S ribosome-binding GTPase [Desemzia sp. RIT804]|uniref:YcjF family protein n=1 Tax=Desemzia sp. RIT 804 TaxID=2810209 RepID=UPI0019501BD3|nr:GTPase [Desemzia sp. RIT 804]MBM6613790.1 50S ribosome-binding GTPase [Desemzia sp. RIT 804]
MKKQADFSVVEEILHKTKEEVANMHPINILLAGKTGVGKSTLINNVFRERLAATGVGKPVTQHLRKISKEHIPIVLYDTKGLELKEETQKTVKKEIFETIKNRKELGAKEAIHVAYYCINANSSRIEQMEIEMIRELSAQIPVIIVLTQSMGKPANEFKSYIEDLNLDVASVINIMAEDFQITEEMAIPAFGLKELIQTTFEIIPEETKEAFNNAQQVDIALKAKSARNWAVKYIVSSFGIGFVPIPFSDASLLVPMQIGLLAHITAIFGISMDKATITSLVAAIGGTGGATFAGRYIVSNIVKFIPGAGTIAGGFISGTTASMVTTALAMSYIEVLTIIAKGEKDGKYPDLKNIEVLMREKFEERLKRGGKGKQGNISSDTPLEDPKQKTKKKWWHRKKE